MVVVVPPPPALSPDVVSLFYVVDELLARSPILIFYGPSATPTAAANNSRIQAHIFSPAGLQSYPRLTISPSSSLYSAVNCLPREEQGDEVCRGLAFSLYKYFAELPAAVKQVWENQPSALGSLRSAPVLFSDSHAAILASRMAKVENVAEVIQDLWRALAEQSLSWLDLDVVLPPGSIKELNLAGRDSILPDPSDEDIANHRFGLYAPLVELFGEPAFLPTTRLRRAPSKPTVLNRSGTFTRKQKEIIRREMCELLDTEESYVSKLYDLVHSVAEDFRLKARTKRAMSASPSEDALKGLFPASLDHILDVNSAFLDALRAVVEETENDAIQDIESTAQEGTVLPQEPTRTDVTGTLSLAVCLRNWFPKFSECYTDYTQAHSHMSNHLRLFMKETGSSFSKRMQETGEQRLTSMLIEPVQRLPRYNLYIDNILKQLPARHPALKSLLKARDTISGICSHDAAITQPSRIIDNLCALVGSWPQTFRPNGRLVSAIDVVELPPPYRTEPYDPRAVFGILLLFTDFLVVLRKSSKQSVSARGLMAQIDGTDIMSVEWKMDDLIFRQALELHTFDLTEMDSGKMVQLVPLQSGPKPPNGPRRPGSSRPGSLTGESIVQVFCLTGANEGKASRVVEDLARARVEGRFSENERESYKWEARCAAGSDLSIFLAMFEQSPGEKPEGRGLPARIRIVVDPTQDSEMIKPGRQGVEVAATLTVVGDGFYRLEIDASNDYNTRDHLTTAEFLPVLTKRLSNLLQMRNQMRNPALAATLLLRNQHILQSLKISTDESKEDGAKDRLSRPHSPVKILTNLFGGSVSREPGSFRKHNAPPVLGDVPKLDHPKSSRRVSDDASAKSTTPTEIVHTAADALSKLEETLASYILALHSRKGNIVGKTLRSRSTADELAVNEIYNALLEDPASYEIVAQASVDVLFSAFEKFIKVAWYDKIGPVISPSTWSAIQSKLDSVYPGDFEEFFRICFGEMSPQNQRALRACVKLLADLLGGTGNDGDRGILTASFAEVLVPDGNPNEFVSVLDRLVEDVQALLGEPAASSQATPYGSASEANRTRTTNTGSLTSNTSLRKKFGLGTLARKNSKLQSDDSEKSDLVSVWRALSKSKHGNDDKAASMSKASSSQLSRANSTDTNVRLSPKRPVSRDRPTVLGAFAFENSSLVTIGEGTVIGPPRKKRRSSLSDLRSLHASAGNTPTFTTPRTGGRDNNRLVSESPRTPSPTKQSLIPAPTSVVNGLGLPSRKENSPIRTLPRPLNVARVQLMTPNKADEVAITSHHTQTPSRRRKDSASVSGIPTLKSPPQGGLSERPTSGNIGRIPPQSQPMASPEKPSLGPAFTPSTPSARLRMQSPQKLRERLQSEKRVIETANSTLQAELSKISEEIKSLPRGTSGPAKSGHSRDRSANNAHALGSTPASNSVIADTLSLEAHLANLATKQTTLITSITSRLDALSSDISSSLQVSESRAKKLDELYREANAENEALYARFNEEIAKVVGKVRAGQGGEEVKKRMAEAEEEATRLRKENGRLRREVVGLRAQLRD